MNARLERASIQQPELLIRTGYRTRLCGSPQPGQLFQLYQESAFCRLPLAECLLQRLKANNRLSPRRLFKSSMRPRRRFLLTNKGNVA